MQRSFWYHKFSKEMQVAETCKKVTDTFSTIYPYDCFLMFTKHRQTFEVTATVALDAALEWGAGISRHSSFVLRRSWPAWLRCYGFLQSPRGKYYIMMKPDCFLPHHFLLILHSSSCHSIPHACSLSCGQYLSKPWMKQQYYVKWQK